MDHQAIAREFAARETSCCSFSALDLEGSADGLIMRVSVRESHADVLGALIDAAERDAHLVDA